MLVVVVVDLLISRDFEDYVKDASDLCLAEINLNPHLVNNLHSYYITYSNLLDTAFGFNGGEQETTAT